MQQKIDILIDLISKSGLNIKQKKLAFKIMNELIFSYNINEAKYYERVKKDHKIKAKDFIDYFDRVQTLLYVLDISEPEILCFNFKYISWIKEHLNEFLRNLNMEGFKQINIYLECFEACYNNMPYDLIELKEFILEPLEIKEEDYDSEFEKALVHFRNTGEKQPILQIGFFKKLQNKVKSC